MGNHKLRKDDPVYYKVVVNKLIQQAKDNGLEVEYEICSVGKTITRVYATFKNDIGEIACATIYELEGSKHN